MMFRDQVGVLAGWFKGWNECEQTVALLSLLKRVSRTQARFLQLCLEHSLADCTELHVLEGEANNPGEFAATLIFFPLFYSLFPFFFPCCPSPFFVLFPFSPLLFYLFPPFPLLAFPHRCPNIAKTIYPYLPPPSTVDLPTSPAISHVFKLLMAHSTWLPAQPTIARCNYGSMNDWWLFFSLFLPPFLLPCSFLCNK